MDEIPKPFLFSAYKNIPAMNILDFPIRKKPRRSTRLEVKGTQEKKLRQVSSSSNGFFDILPPELIHSLFQWLDGELIPYYLPIR